MSARAVLVLLVLSAPLVLSTLAADPPKPPSADEIATAIRHLGDSRYTVREQATKRLWQAGPAAEAALRDARKSADAEVARRARDLLDKIEWGIDADTPNDVVSLIEKYRAGDGTAQQQAIRALVNAGKPGLTALARIGRRVTPEAREQLAAEMTVAARVAVPKLLRARDHAAAGELLEACVASGVDAALTDYTAFALIRGQLDAMLARWQAASPPRPAVLAVLYRAKGDLAAARKHATASGNAALLEEILWEQGDWAELARRPVHPDRPPAESRATAALLHHRAGDAPALDADLTALRQPIQADENWTIPAGARRDGPVPVPEQTNLFATWTAAKALLLIERPTPALTLLENRPEFRAQQFDLLASQLRYRDALAIAERPVNPRENGATVAIKQARLLYLLGDADRAGKAFAKVAAGLKTADDLEAGTELVEAQLKVGLADVAREQAANFLGELTRQSVSHHAPRSLLGAVFSKRGDEAWVWWSFFRQKFPQDDPAGTMKRVRALLDPSSGAAGAGPGEWADALIAAQPVGEADAKTLAHDALAAAYEFAGQFDAAKGELTRACEKSKDAARWLRLGDFLAARKDYAAAATAFEESAKLDPAGPLAVYLHGRALEKTERVAEGREKIEQAYAQSLGNTLLRAGVAADLAKRGHDDLARRERDLVLKLGWPRAWADGGLLSALARAAVARKEYAAAADWYDRITALLLADGKDFVEASGLLGVPSLGHAYRAQAALMADKLDVARTEIDRCMTLTPGNLDMALLVVPELDRRGHKADADAVYGRVAGAYASLCREFPRSPFAHNAAAWLAAGCRRDLDAAVEHARTATAGAPKNAGFLDTLAEVHFQRGEQGKAIELMKKCLTMDPKNAYFAKQLRRFEAGDRDAPVPPEGDDD